MEFSINRLVNPAVASIQPYQPGKPIAECQRELGIAHFIKLASNENPLGVSRHVTDNLAATFAELHLYPDGAAYSLKQALSAHLQVNADQLLLGNGSEEVLRMIMQTFVWGDQEILIPEYSFIAYKISAAGFGLKVKEVAHKNYHADLAAILAAVTPQTKMIILANPNNPTGTYVTAHAFKSFLNKLPPQVIVVCDEAYSEYMLAKDYPQTIPFLAEHPNLIITRTFSKAYGMAGLRVGYAVAQPGLISQLEKVRLPFTNNSLGQMAAVLALQDQAFVEKSALINQAGLAQLMEGLTALGVEFIPSVCNFVMVKLEHAGKRIYEGLLRKGIIVRPLDPYGLQEFIRITIGTEAENVACLHALEQVLCEEEALA